MSATPNAVLRMVALGAHVLAALVLVLLFLKTGGMTLFCVIPGALIGCASVAARRDRPVTLYVAFGLLMGYVFWVGVSAVNQMDVLSLIPVVLLAVGAVWLLQTPSWPSALFTGFAILLCFGLAVVQYRLRNSVSGFDPDQVRRGAVTSVGILALGVVYLGLGFAEALLAEPRKTKRVRRQTATPDEDDGD